MGFRWREFIYKLPIPKSTGDRERMRPHLVGSMRGTPGLIQGWGEGVYFAGAVHRVSFTRECLLKPFCFCFAGCVLVFWGMCVRVVVQDSAARRLVFVNCLYVLTKLALWVTHRNKHPEELRVHRWAVSGV